MILPTGVLSRSETAVRSYIRKKCFVDAVVSLPDMTFYNTPISTYILCITRKQVPAENTEPAEQSEPVLAYLVREVGETRDARRFPCKSDLPDLVRQFRAFYADKPYFAPRNLNCKLIPIEKLRPADRWDVDRFWTDEERLSLGLRESQAITVREFESELNATVEAVTAELVELREEAAVEQDDYMELELNNKAYFEIARGHRVTRRNAHDYPGDVPVVSGHREQDSYIGFVSDEWAAAQGIPISHAGDSIITVNANGSVGTTFLRTEDRFIVHDDVNMVRAVSSDIYPPYLVYAIRESVAKARFRYDAKLYQKRLGLLMVRIPITEDGAPDMQQQMALALQYERLESLRNSIVSFAEGLSDKFITSGEAAVE